MNKPLIRLYPLMAVFLLASVGCSTSRQSTRAMYDWELGVTTAYEINQDQTQSIEIPGQGTQDSETNSLTKMSVEPTGPLQFKIVVTDASVTGSPLPVDPIIGLESNVVLQPNGRLVSASGLVGNAYVDGIGGEEVFRESYQLLFQSLPEEPLAAGMEWTETNNTPISRMGLELTREVSTVYRCTQLTTHEGVEAFEIESTADVSMTGSGNQGGGDMDFSIQGTMEGKSYIDAATGRLLSLEQKGGLAGIIDMAQASLPITIDMIITASMTE